MALVTCGQLSESDRAVTTGVTTGATFGVKVAPVNDEDDDEEVAEKRELVSATDTFMWVESASNPTTANPPAVLTVRSAPGDGVALTTGDARPDRLVGTLHCVEGQLDRRRAPLQRVRGEERQQVVDVEAPRVWSLDRGVVQQDVLHRDARGDGRVRSAVSGLMYYQNAQDVISRTK